MANPLSVGDLLQITALIFKICESCNSRKGAPAEYAELKNEVAAMEAALNALEGAIAVGTFRQRLSENGLVESTENQVQSMLDNCRLTLNKVLKELGKYSHHLDVLKETDVKVKVAKGDDGGLGVEAKEERGKAKSSLSWPKHQNPKQTSSSLDLPSSIATSTPSTCVPPSNTNTTQVSTPKSNNKPATQPPPGGDKKGKHGGVFDFFGATVTKIRFGAVKVDELVKITNQLKFHTGCLQLFLQILNTQSNQRIETDIDLIKRFVLMSMSNTMNWSRHRAARNAHEMLYVEGLSTQENWLLENSYEDDQTSRLLNEILSRTLNQASEGSSTPSDKEPIHHSVADLRHHAGADNEATTHQPSTDLTTASVENQTATFSAANNHWHRFAKDEPFCLSSTTDRVHVMPLDSSFLDSPGHEPISTDSKTLQQLSKHPKQTTPSFSLYLETEEPHSRNPGLLLCPNATLSERWLACRFEISNDIGYGETFICMCSGEKEGSAYHREITEFQVGFNSFCTRRVRGHDQRESEWTIEKLKRGNTSHTIRISGYFSYQETCWLDENLVLPIVTQYGRYLQANCRSDLRANPSDNELEYARYMGYCYSPHDEALIEGTAHTLPESISFAPLLFSVTTPILHPLKESSDQTMTILDITHCYIVLYDSILQTEEAPLYSSFAPFLAKTAEITIICGEQTKARHDVEMVLARFSEDTKFRTSFSSQACLLEFLSEQGRINFSISNLNSEFSENIRLNFVSQKALSTFLGVLHEFQWKLMINSLKYGKANEELDAIFLPSVLDFKTLSFTSPKVHILLAEDLRQVRLYAESGDGESCFSIELDLKVNNWQTKQYAVKIVANVDSRVTGMESVTGSFSQIQFAKVEDKREILSVLERIASRQREAYEGDSSTDEAMNGLTGQMRISL